MGEIIRGIDEIAYHLGPLEDGSNYVQDDDVDAFAIWVLVVE